MSVTLGNLGAYKHSLGNHSEAERLYCQSLELKKQLGDKPGIAITQARLGLIRSEQGQYMQALSNFLHAGTVLNRLKSPHLQVIRNDIARVAETVGEEEFKHLLRKIVEETGVDVSWLEG